MTPPQSAGSSTVPNVWRKPAGRNSRRADLGRISPLAKGPYFTAHEVCPRLIATEPGTAHVTENNMAVGDPADRPPATVAPKVAPLPRRD